MKYRISETALRDLQEIKKYGIKTFGHKNAIKYIEAIRDKIRLIARLPLIYQELDHIRPNYRRAIHKSHSIYFKIENEQVIIMRVIGKQEL